MIIPSKFDGYVEGGRVTSVRRVYDMGGSSAPPASQTQVTDLPDWAKPYAQETLAKTKALTESPYQAYGAPRIAGFSPLQIQAQESAAAMRPSELGQFGGQVAGAASLGALGTQYSPFRMGQFTSGRAAQYMNPFVEQAMEPQLREAQRASEIQQQTDQAHAVRAGAFGGSRQALIEAERQRNLGQLQGDIRARGYMSAFDQAQQQFAREQQLREQSRQFGAGLGMQGLQTAIQGAGQMGALGGQQFGQAMDINRLQQQTGAQQQALRQQGLTQAYQDFLNEQNYPYKQLGFMSDMIRGLPLGQQSVRQIYEPPGSMTGQVAGLGMGLYGLASAGKMFGMAEGGSVDEYAEGGVTSDYFVDDALEKLSDAQLQQARLAALNGRDQRRLQMIDDELAERASLRAGLGSMPVDFAQFEPDEESMAAGGIVAFAGPTEDNNYSLVEDPQFSSGISAGAMEADRARVEGLRARRAEEEERQRMEFLRAAAPEVYERRMAEKPKPAPRTAPSAAPTPAPKEAPPTRTAARQPASREAATEVVRTLADASRVEIPKDKTIEIAESLHKTLMSRPNAEQAEFKAELEAAKSRAKDIEARGISEALMKFGFGMAAAAAKPGRRQGLAGVLESAAAASPLLSESLAENAKLKQAAEDNYMKLRMENARYQNAVDQGNMQLAATIASGISQRELTLADLQNRISQNDRLYELEKKKLAVQQSQVGRPTDIQKIANDLQSADPKLDRKTALSESSRLVGYSFRTEGAQAGKLAAELRKIDEEFSTLKFLDPNSKMAQNLAAQRQQRVTEAYRLYGTEQPGGVRSGSGQVYRFDAKGNPIQ